MLWVGGGWVGWVGGLCTSSPDQGPLMGRSLISSQRVEQSRGVVRKGRRWFWMGAQVAVPR